MKASEFSGLISECCGEVLDAMYFTSLCDLEPLAADLEYDKEGDEVFSFTLRFAGDISGRFGLWLKPTTARILAANFLGDDEANVSATDASEVAGELANMFCGSVMSRVEGEHKFVLSHPEASSRPSFSLSDDFCVCPFSTDSGSLTVWIIVEGTLCPL